MPRKVLSLFFLFFLLQSQAQLEEFPRGESLKSSKLHRSLAFSSKKLAAKLSSKELQIVDTLLNGECFIAKTKHKNGDYALLRKRGKKFEVQYLAFGTQNASPYFVNDSLDMNRDKRNEIIIYWSAVLNSYSGYSTYEGTKTGLLILSPIKRRVFLSCDLSSCGAGVPAGNTSPEGLCHYQYALSFMPMSVVVTTFRNSGETALAKPNIKQYNFQKNRFLLMRSTK